MQDLIVAISIVKDGSMLNRLDENDPEVIENRKQYLPTLGITMEQTTRLNVNSLPRATEQDEKDWCRYVIVSDKDKGDGMFGAGKTVADAVVTDQPQHALMLPVADCTGTVLYDPVRRVLMVTHLGRHSLEQHGGIKSVQFLVDTYGSNPADILVWTTPSPSKKVFPIWALDNKGMKEVVFEQLDQAGILPEHITDNRKETDSDPDYFSYTEFYNGRAPVDGDHMIIAMMH